MRLWTHYTCLLRNSVRYAREVVVRVRNDLYVSYFIDNVARLPLGSLSYRHGVHLLMVRDDNDLVAY